MCLRVKDCCRIDLRVAGFITACLHIVLSCVLFGLRTRNFIFKELHFDTGEAPTEVDFEELYISVIFSLVWLVASAMIIFGIVRNNHILFLPWLRLGGIFLAITMPGIMLAIFYYMYTMPTIAMILLGVALIIGIFLWLYIVIYSLYEEIKDKNMAKEAELNLQYIERVQSHGSARQS